VVPLRYVAREYGLPAVIGTGSTTKRIKAGDRLRVDAHSGVVEILG
jgi:pyruvate,water dikinase